ncbi:hypothetical protein Bca52824_052107 [Brassica carinata]|uniref:3-oxoacyl-[acyl-carrier-protein] reductase n=1 Tax=Brassica carinata TaxID=52824 RepID=A0A8X7R3U6_BRACI|nr:hypothetical protein Bca52824_052107 [Brassica carinata]
MDSINRIINFVFPPLALYGLFVFYPIYQRLKSAVSIWRNVLRENVAGKVVLITGAASGIGEATYEYGKKGAYLALVDIRDEPLFHVAALVEHYGSPEVIPMVADVSKIISIAVDHLVTNAGVAPLYLFEDIDDLSMAMPAMDKNFWGSVYCTFFASSYLKKSRGKIVVIASGCGCIASPRLSFYCASKAAVIAFYETLRIEFGSKVHISLLPVESAERCAKAILRSVCRGDGGYLLEPAWISCVILWKVFCSEVTDSLGRWLVMG